MLGPSYFNENTTPFNVSVGFAAPVSGIEKSEFQTFGGDLQRLIQLSSQMYVLNVLPGTNRDGSISTYIQVSLPANAADQGNVAAFYTSQYSADADQPGSVRIDAPSYYTTGQTKLRVPLTFSRGPLQLSNYRQLQAADVTVSGGATFGSLLATCPRLMDAERTGAGAEGPVPVPPSASAAATGSAATATATATAAGGRRAQIVPGFGPCLLYTAELNVKGGSSQDPISIAVAEDALGTNSNAAGSAQIAYDSGGRIDGATLTYTGAPSYGPDTQAVYAYVQVEPYVDPDQLTGSMIDIQSPNVKMGSFQAYAGGGFGGQPAVTSIRMTLYPTVEENFTIAVAEDELPPPGNKPFSQLIRFAPGGSSGGGGGNPRPIRLDLAGPSQYSEATAASISFQLRAYVSDALKQQLGDMKQLVTPKNFEIMGGRFADAWINATSWPAEYYDDATTTFYFNVTAIMDPRSKTYPSPLTVQVIKFPNTTMDRPTTSYVYFTSVLPRVDTAIESPAYYTVANDSNNRPMPQMLYINVHLSEPATENQFLPSMLTLQGCAFSGNTTARQWTATNDGKEFLAMVMPLVGEDGGF